MWLIVDELRAVNLDSALEVVIEEDYATVQWEYDHFIFAEGSIGYEEIRRWLLLQQRLTKEGMSPAMAKVDKALFDDLLPAWINLKDCGADGAEKILLKLFLVDVMANKWMEECKVTAEDIERFRAELREAKDELQ